MIQLKKVFLWKTAVEAISSFISEGNFRFSDDGVKFKAIDPAQVVLVNYELNKKFFDKYEVEPSFVGLDIAELSKIMGRAQLEDSLSMDLTDNELIVRLEGEMLRTFKLPLIDVADDEVNLPKHEADATVTINARVMKEALKDASLFGSSIVLKVNGGKFAMEAKGAQGVLDMVSKGSKKVSVKASKDVTAKYSLNNLQNIVKEADPNKSLELHLKSEAPLKVTYSIGESPIEFYLAHMIL